MKIKNRIASIICSTALMAMCAGSASAVDCPTAVVGKTGVYPNTDHKFMVQLTCTDTSIWNGVRQFYLTTDLGESGFATLLTARSLGKTVYVRVGGTTSGSLVTIVYLNTTDAP